MILFTFILDQKRFFFFFSNCVYLIDYENNFLEFSEKITFDKVHAIFNSHTYTHIHTHTHAHTLYIFVYVYIYKYIYVYIYKYIYIYIYIYTF